MQQGVKFGDEHYLPGTSPPNCRICRNRKQHSLYSIVYQIAIWCKTKLC